MILFQFRFRELSPPPPLDSGAFSFAANAKLQQIKVASACQEEAEWPSQLVRQSGSQDLNLWQGCRGAQREQTRLVASLNWVTFCRNWLCRKFCDSPARVFPISHFPFRTRTQLDFGASWDRTVGPSIMSAICKEDWTAQIRPKAMEALLHAPKNCHTTECCTLRLWERCVASSQPLDINYTSSCSCSRMHQSSIETRTKTSHGSKVRLVI